MAQPKILLYLVHQDTGQRYPISYQEVIVGRAGDIPFLSDPKISQRHCRVFHTAAGVMIQDLGSANGTILDGRILSPEKAYNLKRNSVIKIGGQVLKCMEPTRPKNLKLRKRKKARKESSSFLSNSLILILALAALFIFIERHIKPKGRRTPASVARLQTPFEMVDQDIQNIFEEYRRIGRAKEAGQLNSKALAQEIRKKLIPGFTSAQEKLSILRPSGEWERRSIVAHQKLLAALIQQVQAMALHAETKNPKYEAEVDRLTQQLHSIHAEVQSLKNRR